MRAMPAEQPLTMPRAPLHGPRQPARERHVPRQWWHLTAARAFLVIATLGLGSFGCYQMYMVIASLGPTPLQWLSWRQRTHAI